MIPGSRSAAFREIARATEPPLRGVSGTSPGRVEFIRAVPHREAVQDAGVPAFPNPHSPNESEAFELHEDAVRGQIRQDVRGVDRHVGGLGHLVGIVDSGEFLDEARPRLRVEPLAVARLADFHGRRGTPRPLRWPLASPRGPPRRARSGRSGPTPTPTAVEIDAARRKVQEPATPTSPLTAL